MRNFVWQGLESNKRWIKKQRLNSQFINEVVAIEQIEKQLRKMKGLTGRGNSYWYEKFGAIYELIFSC